MLTRKQYELLMFIHARVRESGVPPSFDEMKEAVNLKSKSGIHRLISALEERGFLRRLPHRARALEVLKLPENVGQRPAVSGRDARSGGAQVTPLFGRDRVKDVPSSGDGGVIEVGIFGRIAAGTPIEALQEQIDTVQAPAAWLSGGEHYALEVVGDSMRDAGILDGDTVLIRRGDTADSGDIIVALVDGQEATLKRLRRRGESIALEPANPDYETRIFRSDRVKVQGRLAGLLRRY